MSRIELPATDAHMQDLMDRYGPTAVTIGLNQVRTKRLDAFMDEFTSEGAEPFVFDVDGREEVYTQRMTSGVTLGGMMIHARLHRLPHTVDKAKRYVLVVDSLFDTEPEAYWYAGSYDRSFAGGMLRQTEITATQFAGYGYGPRSVEAVDETPIDETERLLESALDRLHLPQMTVGDSGWRLRVGPEATDEMHKARDIQDKVARLRSELAVSVLRRTVQPAGYQLAPTGSDE